MPHSFIQLLLNPEGFFCEMEGKEGNLVLPALIVLVMGIISAISAYFIMGLTVQLMPASQRDLFGVIQAVSVVTGIASAFIMWLVVAALLYGISALLGGKGTFRRLLEYTGLGFLPQLFGSALSLYFMFDLVSSTRMEPVEDPTMISQAMQALMSHPSMVLAQVVSLIFLLWSANIWIFGTKYARGLSTRNAVISVIVPVGLYVAYMLFVIAGNLGVV